MKPLSGPKAHAVFLQKVSSYGPVGRMKDTGNNRSIGSAHYYRCDDDGWYSRIYIFNYFSLLANAPLPASWQVRFYSRTGKLLKVLSGSLRDFQTEVIDVKSLSGLDTFGIVHVKVSAESRDARLDQPYGTIFFHEQYHPETSHSVIAHSLGAPSASHYDYRRCSTGWMARPGFQHALFIANGCHFHPFLHGRCGVGEAAFINHRGERLVIPIPSLGPMGCAKIDLFQDHPQLVAHLSDQQFAIELNGKNILSKPFLFQWNHTQAFGEHL